MDFYGFEAKNMAGKMISMSHYKGKVVLIVNTASKCGLSSQFKELEQLHQEYKEKGLEILGFPCNQFASQDPGSNQEVHEFCQLNYGVTFTMFEKIDVNGANAHPMFQHLRKQAGGFFGDKIKWNFTKFLIDSNGNVVKRYGPTVQPLKIKNDIDQILVRK